MDALNNSKDENSKAQAYSIYNALLSDRQTIQFDSILRSIFIAFLAIGLLWLFISKKIQILNYKVLLVILSIIGLFDLMSVNSSYLSSESFIEKIDQNATTLKPQGIEMEIQKDKSDFRVLDLREDRGSFNSAISSSFYNNIGGYNPAKLSLYQDLIANQIINYPNCIPTLNMLNTKYFVNQQGQAYTNPDALGSAWFVKGIQWAKDPAAEMNALTTLNAKDTAVMNLANQKSMSGLNGYDSAASIKLVSKSNDVLQYQANTKNTQLAVFSEIYYDKGWKAYIDNKETPILKSNYLLRSIVIPAGSHTVKFEFKPESYYSNIIYAQICEWLSILLILILIGTWVKEYNAKQKKELR